MGITVVWFLCAIILICYEWIMTSSISLKGQVWGGMRKAPLQWLLLRFRGGVKTPSFISSHNGIQKLISFLCVARENSSAQNPCVLWSSVNILCTQRAHNFLDPNFSVKAPWIVVLDTSVMMWCNSLIVPRRFARISPSVFWRRSPEIKDWLPLVC
jgi:hypothetical protein